jgi:gamma-glutamyltranspeptidase/glutathione hydrolase
VVCGQGPAPAGASIAHYRGHLGLDIVPGTGLLPACVPGTFETYMMILRDHGTMRLRDVLEPALGYARNGHPLVERACATIATVESLFREHWPTSAATYLPGGKVPVPGTMFTNQRHADTYARILKEAEAGGGDREAEIERARQSWSQGFVAEAIDAFCRKNAVMDVSGRPHHGVLTAQDMASWLPTREQPLHLDFGSYRVLKPDSWTQGPVLLQMLALLKGFRSIRCRPPTPSSCICGRSAPSSPMPTVRRSTAIRSSSRCRCDAAVGGLQRRAAQAGRRRGLARAASRADRGFRRQGDRQGREGGSGRCRRADLRAHPHRAWGR